MCAYEISAISSARPALVQVLRIVSLFYASIHVAMPQPAYYHAQNNGNLKAVALKAVKFGVNVELLTLK